MTAISKLASMSVSLLLPPLIACTALVTSGCGGRAGGDTRTSARSQYVDAALPAGPIGLYAEGVLAREAGDEDRALSLLIRAAADADLIMPNQVLGEIFRKRNQHADSERFFRRMLDLDAGTPRNYFNLAQTQELLKRFAEAVATYQAGLKLDPDDAAGNLGIGRCYLALDNPTSAVTHLDRATSADAENGEAWLYLGRAHDALENYPSAETAYRRAMETMPAPTTELVEALGVNLTNQGKSAEAIPLLERAASDAGTARSHKLLGDAHLVGGDWDEAMAEYDVALTRDAGYVPALNSKGSVYMLRFRQGAGLEEALRDQALALWRRSLELDPNQPAVQQAIDQFSRDRPIVE